MTRRTESGRHPRRAPSLLRSLVSAVAGAVLATLLGAASASAHVTVDPSSTEPGGYSVLTFRVPTESSTARTVAVTVRLPADAPFTSVRTEPVPGWTAKLTTSPLATPLSDDDGDEITSAVSQVTWTATGRGLEPGEFGEFRLSVGPLPPTGTVQLPTVQRYSDGTEVDWVQQAQGGAEPEHPAPAVAVESAAAPRDASDDARAGDGWAVALSVLSLVVALAAGCLALVTASSRRRWAGRP
ncbi:MAG TPA: YcnI family protein [Luteimicrobium sp.]|nr:YcnI family protein [Luteimicrobium sp.]